MYVDHFAWQPAADQFEIKRLGTFGEHAIEMFMLRAPSGAVHVTDGASPGELMFALSGAIVTSSGARLETHSAWRVDSSIAGERFEVVADTEIFVVRLPAFA
ncbi:MAG: hypothetical protein ACREH9_02605, partial [Pseudomonadota bacterium]